MQSTIIKKIKMQNGMTVLLCEDHSSPIISICLYAHGGSRYESYSNHGISYFCQQMLLHGTRSRDSLKLSRDLEFLGAELTPFANKDSIGIYMNILSKNFIEGFNIFLDVVVNPSFKSHEAEKARKNILAAIYNNMDNLISFCQDECDKALFQNHPYSLMETGSVESVSQISAGNLARWHADFYNPENIVISIVGDFKAEYAEEQIVEKLKLTKLKKIEKTRFAFTELPPGRRQAVVEREKKQVVMSLGFFAPGINSPDYIAFKLLQHVLSGMSSRLFIELRDNYGLAYIVDADYKAYLDVGVFKIYLGTSIDKLELAESLLFQELNKLKYKELQNKELDSYKRYLLGLQSIQEQRKEIKALRYGYYELTGRGFNFANEFPGLINKVTPKEIRDMANKYLNEENCALAIIKPKM